MSGPATVTVHALSAGHFTLPEYQFVSPVSETARKTVPSLAFLIQHVNVETGQRVRILFDLGLRKNTERYISPIRRHITTRQPMKTTPDVVESLANGGLTPGDIDYILYSHVHWDHVGEPRDFPDSIFIVGHGSYDFLSGTAASSLRGGHSFFEHDLLPKDQSIELPDPRRESKEPLPQSYSRLAGLDTTQTWQSYKHLPKTLDLFGDKSLMVVDSPGHLPGHLNILARIGENQLVYLAGDAFHDRRLLTGDKDIGTWHDTEGHTCCIHSDVEAATATLKRIRQLEIEGVEVIAAHDSDWAKANTGRFYGAS